MAGAGRARQPTVLGSMRAAAGVVKNDAPVAAVTKLVAPAVVPKRLRARFDALARELQSFIPPLVTGVDAMLVAQYVLVEDEVNALTRAVGRLGRGGVYPTKDSKGKTLAYAVRPEVDLLRSRRYELLTIMQHLGMTPRARSSMKGTRVTGGGAGGAGAGKAEVTAPANETAAGQSGLDGLAAGGGPADPGAAGVVIGGVARSVQVGGGGGGGEGERLDAAGAGGSVKA